jgi:cytochrome P450 / NADPH-cytochrome P450 reductase
MSCPHSHDDITKRSAEMPTQEPTELATIPQPPMAWLTGNLRELNPDFPNSSIWRLADIYGPIYKLVVLNREVVVVSSQEFINEVCDDDRFEKTVSGSLEEVRALARDGLFTAYGHEPVSR